MLTENPLYRLGKGYIEVEYIRKRNDTTIYHYWYRLLEVDYFHLKALVLITCVDKRKKNVVYIYSVLWDLKKQNFGLWGVVGSHGRMQKVWQDYEVVM